MKHPNHGCRNTANAGPRGSNGAAGLLLGFNGISYSAKSLVIKPPNRLVPD